MTEKAVDLFLEPEQAEAFVAEAERDEPETALVLRVEAVDPDGFRTSMN